MAELVPVPVYPELNTVYISIGFVACGIISLVLLILFLCRKFGKMEKSVESSSESLKKIKSSIIKIQQNFLESINSTKREVQNLEADLNSSLESMAKVVLFQMMEDINKEEDYEKMERKIRILEAFVNSNLDKGFWSEELNERIKSFLGEMNKKWVSRGDANKASLFLEVRVPERKKSKPKE